LLVIDKGLEAGEQIIMTGQLMVMPGGKVNVVNPPANNNAQAKS
jgi:hypothetical protein